MSGGEFAILMIGSFAIFLGVTALTVTIIDTHENTKAIRKILEERKDKP